MTVPDVPFEVIVRVEADRRVPGLDEAAHRVRAVVDPERSATANGLVIEHWEPRPVRGPLTRAFLTSVGVASLTKASLAGVAGVLNELVAAFEGSAAAEIVTIEVGDQVIRLADVTPAMIDSWLPAAL